MSPRLRLAVVILPIILGAIVLSLGYNEYLEATVPVIVKDPPPFGIIPFSSMNLKLDALRAVFWITDVKKGKARILHSITVSVASPQNEEVFSEEQTFGFQFLYPVTNVLPMTEAKAWSELESEYVTIEITDMKVELAEGGASIVYLIFAPLAGMNYYDFSVWFYCREAIIQKTFSTYSLYIPISTTQNNVFAELMANLNYSVHHLDPVEQHFFEIGTWLPPDSQVIEVFPALTDETIVSEPSGDDYQAEVVLVWRTSYDYPIDPSPSPKSKVLRVNFEMREDLNRHNRLLFDSGLWIGIGVSNLVGGIYGLLRYKSGMQE